MMSTRSFKDRFGAQSPTNLLMEAALALAMSGTPVFACLGNKAPATKHGLKDATTDPNLIRQMFANAAVKMIGMPTGAITGLVVVDVDRKENRQGGDWLNANSHRLVQTRTNSTGSGGLHLLFNHPGQPVKNQNDKIAPGIDVRGDGGYIIVPPSPGYGIADDAPVADIPDWLLTTLCPPVEPVQASPYRPTPRPSRDRLNTYGMAALDAECEAIINAPFGQQESTLNTACVKIGGLVAGGELSEPTARNALFNAACSMPSQQGKQPWLPNKLRAKVDKALRDGMSQPRSAPEQTVVIEHNPAAPFIEKINREHAASKAKAVAVPTDLMDVDGVLKMLVDEATRTAQRPQPFLALGAAICAIGVLAGRRYRNRTDLRTNIYVGAIAESGSGKDHATDIVRRCMFAAGLERYLGGESLASGRAITSSLEQHPARLFMVDEFGMFLKSVLSQKAAAHKADIWAEFTRLFSRARGVMGGTEYANQKENARVNIYNPHACFYGTSTPSTFWSALSGSDAMNDGGLARFLLFITDEDRPERNEAPPIFSPTPDLIKTLQAIAAGCPGHDYGGNLAESMAASVPMTPYTVPETDSATKLHRRNITSIEDPWARKVSGTYKAASVARLAEKAAMLSLVRAISRDPVLPVIEERDVTWAWALAMHCTHALLDNADRLLAGNEYEARLQKAREIIRKSGPITERDMMRRGFTYPERDRAEILRSLLASGWITTLLVSHEGAGRPTVKYIIGSNVDEADGGTED